MTLTQIAQIISIVAMAFNILSFQSKSAKGIITFLLCGSSLFAVSFLMLGAYGGGILNIVDAIRALLFMNRKRFKMDRPGWLYGFTGVYLLCYGANFLIFQKEPTLWNFLIELLPVIGMVDTTVAFRYDDAAVIRKFALVSSGAWLIYNIAVFSIGAICCEVLSLISIFVGMLRFDRKGKKPRDP